MARLRLEPASMTLYTRLPPSGTLTQFGPRHPADLWLHSCDHTIEDVCLLHCDTGVIVRAGRHHHLKVERWHKEQALPAISNCRTPRKRFVPPVDSPCPPEIAVAELGPLPVAMCGRIDSATQAAGTT